MLFHAQAAHHLQPAHHRSYTRYFRLGGPITFNQPAAVHSWFLCAVYKCSYFTYLQTYFTHRLCCRVCIAVGNAEIHRPISSSTLKSIFISAKEVMLSSAFVCLFVCLLAGLREHTTQPTFTNSAERWYMGGNPDHVTLGLGLWILGLGWALGHACLSSSHTLWLCCG